jgi:hypothetical protein
VADADAELTFTDSVAVEEESVELTEEESDAVGVEDEDGASAFHGCENKITRCALP